MPRHRGMDDSHILRLASKKDRLVILPRCHCFKLVHSGEGYRTARGHGGRPYLAAKSAREKLPVFAKKTVDLGREK